MNKQNKKSLGNLIISGITSELVNLSAGKYVLFVDLRNGDVNIAKPSRKKKCELFIGDVFLSDLKKGTLNKFMSEVKKIITAYQRRGSMICKKTALYQYGKEFIEKFEPTYVDNPYYKCAAPMCLYDKNVLDYCITINE